MRRLAADVGNSRLKMAEVAPSGRIMEPVWNLSLDDVGSWTSALGAADLLSGPLAWAISSVNPPVARRLEDFAASLNAVLIQKFDSAAKVPVQHRLTHPELTGADRALAVFQACQEASSGGPGQIISCGTAITVDWVSTAGIWEGGAIAPGLETMARALHTSTAQLPEIHVEGIPAPIGPATREAIAAGVFWGVVGTIRELIQRQSRGWPSPGWLLWTGGDAAVISPHVVGETARVVPHLVLQGLARVAFGPTKTESPA